MQIREQGQQVQLIRSPYDSTKKRCVQKVIYTFEKQHSYSPASIGEYLSAEQISNLSDGEKKTLSDWLTAKADKKLADDRSISIITAEVNISRLADAILSDKISVKKAMEIWEAIDKLSKALKKSGYSKSSVKPMGGSPVAPGVLPGQLDLE